MLASTVQFSTYGQSPHIPHRQTPDNPGGTTSVQRWQRQQPDPTRGRPVPSGPNSVPTTTHSTRSRSRPPHPRTRGRTRHQAQPAAELVSVPPSSSTTNTRRRPQTGHRSRPARGSGPTTGSNPRHGRPVLLRKEVIQPHLPVRLPCYDFVPIADPAFDGSLPQGVGPPASGVTDFRDVTGGVYKARERIHRSVADLRLLATPTSWGRVADPNPN